MFLDIDCRDLKYTYAPTKDIEAATLRLEHKLRGYCNQCMINDHVAFIKTLCHIVKLLFNAGGQLKRTGQTKFLACHGWVAWFLSLVFSIGVLVFAIGGWVFTMGEWLFTIGRLVLSWVGWFLPLLVGGFVFIMGQLQIQKLYFLPCPPP